MITSIIAAHSLNKVIGKNNQIPWFIKGDLAYFKSVTMDCPMIMGRKTFLSLPGILKGRKHIIITSNPSCLRKYQNDPRVEVVTSLEEALSYAESVLEVHQCYIIGGGQVYEEAIRKNLVQHLILTEVNLIVDGDIKFPTISTRWRKDFYIDKIDYDQNIKYRIQYLTKR